MKKITSKSLLLSAFLFAINLSIFSQNDLTFSKKTKSGKVRCASTEYEQYLRKNNVDRKNTVEFENWIAPKIQELKKQPNYNKGTEIITIPVVIHIIHNGDDVGKNENISDAQALSQITVLNQDYRKMLGTRGYNNNAVGADVGIEFCMAQRKPDGSPTNGIDRVKKTAANYKSTASTEKMKTETQWDPEQYLNIWTVYFSDDENAEMVGTLGYAQFPSTSKLSGLNNDEGDANTDGVVIDYRYFGTSDIVNSLSEPDYDKGRTTTHEVGHYLGLLHIWGDGDGDSDSGATDCTATDYCNDTPQSGYEHYDCGSFDTCPSKPGKDMPENYMDYTNDVCMNIFTVNQRDRILAVMNNSIRRKTLKTSTACNAVLNNNDFNYFYGVKLYPNPVKNVLNVSLASNKMLDEYTIYNSLGQIIEHSNNPAINTLTINTEFYNKGIYFIKLTKDNATKTYRFIKK